MNNKEHKEFTPEELEEIRAYAGQEAAPDEYRFSNPDPYAKPEPAPEGQPRRFWFDAEGISASKTFPPSGCRSLPCSGRSAAPSTPSQAAMRGRKRWTEN